MAHIVSNTKPPTGEYGDEWFNPIENVTYKLLPASGTNGSWHAFGNVGTTILSTTDNVTNVYLTSTTTFTNTTIATTVISGIPGDIYWNWNSLLIDAPRSNTILNFDASTNRFDVQPFGRVRPTNYTPYQGDGYYSGYFDGTGDYLSAPSNSAFAFGTGDFTVECWIYAISANDNSIFESRTVVPSTTDGFTITAFSSSVIRIYTSSAIISSSGTTYLNTWTHVAVARVSGTTTLYINGVSAGTSASMSNCTNTEAIIGGGRYGGTNTINTSFNGYISNFKVVKGTAVYTTAFTPSITPLTATASTSLLTCQSNRFLDKSTNNFTITTAGDTSVQVYSPFTNVDSSYSTYGSGYFSSTSDYFNIPVSPEFLFSGDYTIECWVYFNGNLDDDDDLISNADGNNQSSWVLMKPANNTFQFYPAGYSYYVNSGITPIRGQWYHVAAVRSGTVISLYVNGVL
jgi:hypothetical protein